MVRRVSAMWVVRRDITSCGRLGYTPRKARRPRVVRSTHTWRSPVKLGWYTDGRDLGYDETQQAFDVGGAAVTPDQVRAYDEAGQIKWSSDAMKDWFTQSLPVLTPQTVSKPTKPVKPLLIVAVVAVIASCCIGTLAIGAIGGSDTESTPTEPSSAEEESTTADSDSEPEAEPLPDPAAAPAAAPAKPDYASDPLTVESVNVALSAAAVEADSVTVEGGVVTVTCAANAWDETDLVVTAAADALTVFKAVFANPAVTQATYVATTAFSDKYGQTSVQPGATITFSRATADKIDWPGLESRVFSNWQNGYKVATSYSIHPDIWKNLINPIPTEGGTGL